MNDLNVNGVSVSRELAVKGVVSYGRRAEKETYRMEELGKIEGRRRILGALSPAS
jgi:hypothetical protein